MSKSKAREIGDTINFQPLPEWIWQLRARWVSTLTYQTIRDSISDYLAPASAIWKTRTIRKRFSPDARYLALTEDRHNLKRNQTPKPEETFPPTNYERLPSQESIRLLHLHPASENDAIEASLSVHELKDLPSYEALSYYWGTTTGSFISCKSQSMGIQENLFHALCALRRRDVERVLWVDAICINQIDTEERNSQVRLMRQIYQRSIRVVIWLGMNTEKSQHGIELLLNIQRLAFRKGNKTSESAQALEPDDLPKLGLPSVDSDVWKSLDDIFWRPWFTRVWIIQELAVSRDAVVMCGERLFSWMDVAHAANFVLRHSLTAITQVDPRRVTKLEKFRKAYSSNNCKQPLLSLVLEARDAFATDDRDKIFALMGLSEPESSGFVPDYSLSVEGVFINFSRFHMSKTGTLDILGAVEDHSYRLKKNLPSWVADWEVHPPARCLSSLSQYLLWDASKGMRIQIPARFSLNGRTLIARGIAVDRILHVSDSFLEYVPLPGTARDWMPHLKTEQAKKMMHTISDFMMQQRFRQWERMARNSERFRGSEDNISAFLETITAEASLFLDHGDPDTSAVPSTLEDFYAAWQKYWNAASQYQGKYISTSYTSTTPAKLQMAVRFMQAHQEAAYGRRFFTSKSRGYMGLCPSLTRRGDQLVVLAGGRTPFVLRDIGHGQFKFVGECYAYGLMHGEAATLLDSSIEEARAREYSIV